MLVISRFSQLLALLMPVFVLSACGGGSSGDGSEPPTGMLPGYPFSAPSVFFATGPYHLELFDLNDDGFLDIINPSGHGDQWTGFTAVLEVFFGSAENPFENSTVLDIEDGSQYASLFDLPGRSKKGLFVASRAGCSVDYYEISESLELTPVSRFSTGFCGDRYVLGVDLNNDGLVDAIANSGSIHIGLNDGDFLAHHNLLGIGAWALQVADLNGNGILDAVAYDGHQTVAVFLGNGDATFQTAQPYTIVDDESLCFCSNCGVVAFGNIDANNTRDFVVANNCMAYSFLGNGDGTFQEGIRALKSTGVILDVAAADLNDNGRLDLVIVEGNYPTPVRIYRGGGDGTFGTPFGVDVGMPEVLRIYVADVDGDGRLDLISAGGYNNSISVTFGE